MLHLASTPNADGGMFYQRVQFDYSDLIVGAGNAAVLERGIAEVANRYHMDWTVSYQEQQKRVAILVRCEGGTERRRGQGGRLTCVVPAAEGWLLKVASWRPSLIPP